MNVRERAEYARRLRAAYKRSGLTGVALSELSGVPYRTIQDFMADKGSTPHADTLSKIATALGVETDAQSVRDGWPDDVRTFTDMVGLYLSKFDSEGERRARMDALTRTMVSGD